jgi:hypothetical protein
MLMRRGSDPEEKRHGRHQALSWSSALIRLRFRA